MSERTLEQWRYKRKGPPYIRAEGRILYRRSQVMAWLDAQTVKAGSDG
ncbi:MAG: hypothetical protein R2705_04900 [Ilumatobacteraceae bacterium]